MRSRVPGEGGRGGRGARDLSPPAAAAAAKMKDNRSDWRRDRFVHRSHRNSLSPPNRDRSRCSPGRRSSSVERRDYGPRRSDYGKQLHHEPPPLSHPRGRHSPFGHDSYELPHRFMFPGDPSNLNPEVNSGSKLSRVIKDKDFLQPGNGVPGTSSLGLETQNMLHQKSLFLDDGSTQTFYSLPADANYSVDAALLKPETMGRSRGPLDMERHDYHDQLRIPYEERQGERAYSKNVPFATTAPRLLRHYGSATSSSLPKDDLLDLYDDHLRQPSDGFIRDGPSKFLDDSLASIGYGQMQLSEPVRRGPLSPARIECRYYGYDELNQRERNNRGYLTSDDMYEKMPWGSRSDHRDKINSSFRDMVGIRIDELDASRNVTSENLWDKQRSLHGDATLDYREPKGISVDYVDGSAGGHLGYRTKPSRVHELASIEETYALGTDATPNYKERLKSPMFSGHRLDIYGQIMSSPRGESEMDDLYQLSSERMSRRKYGTDSYINELEPRNVASNDRTAFRRIPSPGATDDIWPEEERQHVVHSKHFGHTKYKTVSHRMSRSDAWLPSGGRFRHAEHGRGMSLKRRLRPGPSESHGPYTSERRKEFFRPHKVWKRDVVDRHDGLNRDGYVPEDSERPKRDPVEGSEEFKQQVHKAFLRFFKTLNENPQQLKRYRDQGQGSPLLCCVCGSMSKEFMDTHGLVSHLYHSHKVGLKTEHLGLHKALCLLIGWNWLVAPDNTRLYQSGAAAEAKALKEDLILWPPLVVVHNSSVEKKVSNSEHKALSGEVVQEILREMGFEAGKTTICPGKPASQSVFLIKFFPTFSGMQEAERLHKHFADNHRGRQQFHQRTGNKSNTDSAREACFKKFPFLYGYMAVAEDLSKLDSETMKRCVVKSKKDIEAIADAPLNVD